RPPERSPRPPPRQCERPPRPQTLRATSTSFAGCTRLSARDARRWRCRSSIARAKDSKRGPWPKRPRGHASRRSASSVASRRRAARRAGSSRRGPRRRWRCGCAAVAPRSGRIQSPRAIDPREPGPLDIPLAVAHRAFRTGEVRMKSLALRSRVAWSAPIVLVLPLLMGADGKGCEAGGPIPVGSGAGDDASASTDGGGGGGGGVVCTQASCAGMAVPALAKLCPDGTAVSESVCEEQANGKCGWGFPACPSDACAASDLPCVPCPYGSTGTATDANGCPTCPICAPPPDGGSTVDACPPAPICNLPNCMYGVIPQ